ncbi:protein FLOWERING locus D-like protein [Tasmannia lanceolata]|uniref:protein FLOWERING locus D-like protein n=1 Tax=Tasmannia lanceolata TaxID=3420 RepID=UPI0040645A64
MSDQQTPPLPLPSSPQISTQILPNLPNPNPNPPQTLILTHPNPNPPHTQTLILPHPNPNPPQTLNPDTLLPSNPNPPQALILPHPNPNPPQTLILPHPNPNPPQTLNPDTLFPSPTVHKKRKRSTSARRKQSSLPFLPSQNQVFLLHPLPHLYNTNLFIIPPQIPTKTPSLQNPNPNSSGSVNPNTAANVYPNSSSSSVNPHSARIVNPNSAGGLNPNSARIVNPNSAGGLNPNSAGGLNPNSAATVNPNSVHIVNPNSTTNVNPNSVRIVNPNYATTVNPNSVRIVNPNSATTVNPNSVRIVNPNSAGGLNPNSAATFNPNLARSANPNSASSVNPNSARGVNLNSSGSINPISARSVNPNSSGGVNPNLARSVNPNSGGGINPNSAGGVNSNSDISEEIIFINKEATSEALTALSAGFPADSLTEEEIESGVVSVIGGIEQVNYILIRNHILARWRDNVSNWLTKESFLDILPSHSLTLLNSAYNFLVSHGYINFGVASAIKEKIPVEASKPNVVIIGAGLAGLAAARQLMAFGFRVVILEGRKRAGGRVYTKKMEGGNRVAAADLGGSVLTGTLGNPLGILAKQLGYPLHKVRDKCPLYKPNGEPVDPEMDSKVETEFNHLLDKASRIRQLMGEVSVDVSLGAALETFREVYGVEEMSLFNWHLANLEYANAGLLSKLSLAFWDQDDPYDMGGDHCFLPGGNGRLVQALSENLPILYEKTVSVIRYSSNGVQVIAGGQVFEGDMAVCTVPLGVLKSGSIKFVPELPQRKLDAIKRLGFGLLNKVAMLFPHVFWSTDLETFGHLSDEPARQGEFFLFYSYATVAGGPLLIALVAGEAALKFESMAPTDAVAQVLQILKGIYEPQGVDVPDPIQSVCTRWGTDSFSLGSYSHVAVGASGDDYDILAESVGDGRLFFAGEATTRRYPATMHGAFLSGLREAANMSHHFNARALRLKVERNPSKDAQSCTALLADLFREPDLEFGSFSVIFGRKLSDPKSTAILRVTFGGPRKKTNEGTKPDQQHSNKPLFQQLQTHFNQQQHLHVYTMLSRQQALDLREVRGGDEMRLNYLCEKLGVKLVGRRGLGSAADSVISSIKAERGNQRTTETSLALKLAE